MVEPPKTAETNPQAKRSDSLQPKIQKVDYEGTTHCKNKGHYSEYSRCIADKTDCRFYEIMSKQNGEKRGICKKRYDAKQQKKRQQEADIKHTQDISTYNGRGH